MHIPGAGLTNMIFMKPGGVVVETVGIWDGRMLPVCGSFYFKTKFFFVPLILGSACRIHGRSLRLDRAPPLYILLRLGKQEAPSDQSSSKCTSTK